MSGDIVQSRDALPDLSTLNLTSVEVFSCALRYFGVRPRQVREPLSRVRIV